jgi:hypothetical protein
VTGGDVIADAVGRDSASELRHLFVACGLHRAGLFVASIPVLEIGLLSKLVGFRIDPHRSASIA